MSDTRDPATDQQLPVHNNTPAIQDLVIADIDARKQLGLKKYGTLLQANNGRSFLQDLYEELIDACMYVKGALEEERLAVEKQLQLEKEYIQDQLWDTDLFEGFCCCVNTVPTATGYDFYVCAVCVRRVHDSKLAHKQ